jgi:hypothetical protein
MVVHQVVKVGADHVAEVFVLDPFHAGFAEGHHKGVGKHGSGLLIKQSVFDGDLGAGCLLLAGIAGCPGDARLRRTNFFREDKAVQGVVFVVTNQGEDRIVRRVLVAEVAQIDVQEGQVRLLTVFSFRTALEIENAKGELLRLAVVAGVVRHDGRWDEQMGLTISFTSDLWSNISDFQKTFSILFSISFFRASRNV